MFRARIRESLPVILLALASLPVMAWLGLYGYLWTDYDDEVAPAYAALTSGHVSRFLHLAPTYGGSLILRAPFALLPSLWGGGPLAVYRSVAIPCLAAAGALAIWLAATLRSQQRPLLTRAIAVGACLANPLTLRALELGHPEEILGAALCVGAVLCALRARAAWAGLLLGLAIANKQWAVVAIGPVLLALPRRHLPALAIAGLTAGLVLAPLLLDGAVAAQSRSVATNGGTIFQPWQLWWFLGHHAGTVHGLHGVAKIGYRTPPGWIETIAHPLIVLLTIPLCLSARRRDPLLLLVLILALRCALDPRDTIYYLLPFSFALVVWESAHRGEAPTLSLATIALAWTCFQWMPMHLVSADAQALTFAVGAVAMIAFLTVKLYGLHRPTARAELQPA